MVGDNVGQPQVLPIRDALKLADELELDLIEISPKAEPPIRVGESIKIRIYYEYNKQPHLMWSSTLAFLFEDQNHNYWEQPFFYEKDNIYAPYEISYKELKKAVTTDDAYECFEHPWLW